eukprot:COSAG06_NODE_7015_length_2672_cov_11.344988_2_plen_299_part_00
MRAGVEPMPTSQRELLSVPGMPSPTMFALFVTGMMAATFVPLEVTNLAFANFSSREFSADEHSVLGLSLGFSPSSSWNAETATVEVRAAHTRMMRSLYLSDYFSEEPPSERYGGSEYDFVDGKAPPRFHVPNPSWHPLHQDGYDPPDGIVEYGEATLMGMLAVVRSVNMERATHNLPGRLRTTLWWLRSDRSIVIIDTDKNLGLVADDTASYCQHCLDELARTHTRVPESAAYVLWRTLAGMTTAISPYLDTLPDWAAKFLRKTMEGIDPCTGRNFRVPSFRVLYKIHKERLCSYIVD